MGLITINGNTLNPAAPVAQRQTLGAAVDNAADSNYILVQTKEPLKKAQKQSLSAIGVVVKEYVSQNTYLCRYKPEDLAPVRDLDYIDYANVYPTMFVVNPTLRTHSVGPPGHISSRTHVVDVILHKDCEFDQSKQSICEAAHLDPEDVSGCKGKIRLTVQEQHLDALAAIDNVAFIQEVKPNRLFNNVARTILKVEDLEVNGTRLDGTGQLVAVGDTGVDSAHPAFAGDRIKKTIGLGRRNKTNDPDGHGTHVCGSVLGSSTLASGERIQGSAPAAKLVMQSLLDPQGGLGGIPDDLENLFGPAYAEGARVHNNSWGSSQPGLPYDQSCREIDDFVVQNPDMVIVFAAGNDGVDRDSNGTIDLRQVGSQAAAKNCLTVGASENLRPNLTVAYGVSGGGRRDPRYAVEPIYGDQYADDPNGMAAFSSRGPTPRDGRIKPDVVAPGTCILSARSSLVQDSAFYGKSPDPKYMFESGTSMAAPLASGCAALIRQFLVAHSPGQQQPGPGTGAQQPIQTPPSSYSPSAALVKALLINGAVELPGQYSPSEAGVSPNPNSGWGRISVADSIGPNNGTTSGYGEHEGMDEDDVFEFSINIDGSSRKTLKVTLVWTDPAGAILQNDLDLTVIAGSKEKHGNISSGTGSDRVNNVEVVKWEAVPAGEVKVRVSVHHLTTDRQSFAYAWKLY